MEPEHRLVARTLERRWEEQLAAQQQLEEAYHRFLREQPRTLTADERAAIRDRRRRRGLAGCRPHPRSAADLGPAAWWAADLARTLDLAKTTLAHWIRRGWVGARQAPTGLRRWIIWADAAEQERLRQCHQRPVADGIRRRWLQREEAAHAPRA